MKRDPGVFAGSPLALTPTYDIIYVTRSPRANAVTHPPIPAHNLMVECQEPHAELLDLETATVWQSHRPISREAYAGLVLPPTLQKVGIGTGVMDGHYFRRSPGAHEDGPVAEREIEGHLFIHCANPPEGGPESPVAGGPRLLRVDRYHSLIFEAGREVDVIRLPDGRDFVQVIAATPEGGGRCSRRPRHRADTGSACRRGGVCAPRSSSRGRRSTSPIRRKPGSSRTA